MKRRFFNQTLPGFVLAGIGAPYLSAVSAAVNAKIKPNRLKKGDQVGLITPGSYAPEPAVKKAIKNLTSLGLKVVKGKYLNVKRGYNAGTDAQRLEDIHNMFANPAIKAIWCVRGGYGCTRLLPNLDYELIRNNPKILIGFSDITALSNAIFQQTGLVGFHGPLGSSTIGPYDMEHIKAILFDGKSNHVIELTKHPNNQTSKSFDNFTIKKGKTRGTLAGGNLTVLTAMAGTPYALRTSNTLLFLEDIGEKPYRIDRMITQLRQSANVKGIKGIALGIFDDCEADPEDESLTLKETLFDRFDDLNIPVQYGYPFGHIKHQCVFPVGIEAELDTGQKTIRLLENAVQ